MIYLITKFEQLVVIPELRELLVGSLSSGRGEKNITRDTKIKRKNLK